MIAPSPDVSPLAGFLSGWEIVLIAALFVFLFGIKRLAGNGWSHFRKSLDREAHDAGKSVGGILGKPAAEALTPDNRVAELYDPAVFRKSGRGRRGLIEILRRLWRALHRRLRGGEK